MLPEDDETFLAALPHIHEVVECGGEQLLILRGYALPEGRYTPVVVDLLIRIPPGYPTANPDMFFLDRPVRRADGGNPASVTETTINGQHWFQWSRHYPGGAWRPGSDGLETYLRAVRSELEKGK